MSHEKFQFGGGVLGKRSKSAMKNSIFEGGVFLVRFYPNSLCHPREVLMGRGGSIFGKLLVEVFKS